MLDQNQSFKPLDIDGIQSDGPNKKQLIAGGIIIIVIMALAVGIFLWQKKGGGLSFFNKKYDLAKNIVVDSDNDGLTDEEEKIYGTDPEKADTDGDGYSDWEELEKGYNPLGEGKINHTFKKVADHYFFLHKDNKELSFIMDAIPSHVIPYDCDQGDIDKEKCYLMKAVAEGKINYCNKLSIPADRIECIEAVAISNQDEKHCSKLSSMAYGDDSSDRDYCYYDISKEKHELSICEKIKNKYFRYDCIRDIALMNLDPQICNQINDSNFDNPNSIAGFSLMKADCYAAIAIFNKDKQLCDNIPFTPDPPAYEGEPRYLCYSEVAVINKDLNACTDIRNNFRSQIGDSPSISYGGDIREKMDIQSYVECIEGIVDESYQESDCQLIADQETKERCLKQVAEINKNSDICQKITNTKILDDCYLAVGEQKTDLTMCQKITNVNSKDNCLIGVAQNIGDKNICSYVSGSGVNKCYRELAVKLKDEKICASMKVNTVDSDNCTVKEGAEKLSCSQYARDMCYYKVGIDNKSSEACSKIKNSYRRNSCYKNIK